MEMFFYGFMQRAFISGIAMAFITPILGLFLILRRQSLMADTLSHVSLVGVALGFLLGMNPTLTTLIVVIIAAVFIEAIGKYFRGYSEITVAILMSGGMAIALILMNMQKGRSTLSVDQFLFGSIVTITQQQMMIMILLAVVVVGLYVIFRKPLYVLSFDEDTRPLNDEPLYNYHRSCDCSDDANRRLSSSISRYRTPSIHCTSSEQ